MQEDSYPHEVLVSVLIDKSINIFGDSTGETFIFKIFEALLQIELKNQNIHGSKIRK
jgi:hypothetical protein